jgi:uncharacterized protein (DUF305 family)
MSRFAKVLTITTGIAVVAAALVVVQMTGSPDSSSPEAGFARDMGAHHQQAVEMSILVRESTDDPEVNTLAYDILNTQATQRGKMSGWLDVWGLPQTTTRSPMQWAGSSSQPMENTEGRMAGMATKAEMEDLADATGQQAERLYLELMLDHHIGGVDMAEAILNRSDHPVVTRLAQTMVDGQNVEIDYMRELLQDYPQASSR